MPRIKLPATLAIGFACQNLSETKSRTVLLALLRERIRLTNGVVYGISPLGGNGDLLFAEACIELGISLQLLLPLPADELHTRFASSEWVRAKRVLDGAISVETVTAQNSIEDAYYECGVETVQRSSLLVALGGGDPSSRTGKADQVMAFASQIGKPILWIDSAQGILKPLNQAAERRLLHDPELDFLNDLPDCNVACADGSPTATAVQWFKKIDANASKLAPQVRRAASIPILYTAVAAVLSGAASKSSAGTAWIAASAALGITAAVLPVALRLDRRQATWARTRTAAEVCRSMLALWDAPFQSEVIGPEIGSELAGTLVSLRFLKMQATSHGHATLEEFKTHYLKDRILDQMEYYASHAERAEHEAQRYRRVTFCSIGVAVLLALCWLAGTIGVTELHSMLRGRWFGLTLSALFQGATVVGALQIVNDSKRRQRRYRELHGWLRDWNLQLQVLRTWSSVLKVVVQVEKALMVELLEWRSLARNTKLPRK
jgi:hypothetical protein